MVHLRFICLNFDTQTESNVALYLSRMTDIKRQCHAVTEVPPGINFQEHWAMCGLKYFSLEKLFGCFYMF